MTHGTFSVALLTGGQGRRLGGTDKSALVVGGRSILAALTAEARAVATEVFVVGALRGGHDGLRVVPDPVPGAGALAALVTALEHSATDATVVVAADMPFVQGAFLAWLAERLDGHDAVVPRDAGGCHPLCAAYHRRAVTRLARAAASGVRRVQDAVAGLAVETASPEEYAAFDPTGRLLFNVNTPEDYHAALDTDP